MFEDDLYDNSRLLLNCILVRKAITSDKLAVQLEITAFIDAMATPSAKARLFIEECVSPMTYWHQVGATKFPILFVIAQIVFSVPTSQAASERVWSIYDFILTKCRARLSPEKVTKLVELYMNAYTCTTGNLVSVMMGEERDGGASDTDEESKE
ncbi:hypothetical protein H257_12519 [Aphanomyces astaci]|uniref:HAT C-terminal dimerisation domain-containing protein n=1 Tax=Aphanomyces astaci TaxID=112090 RepID=W4FXZ1_APHAT|nr:hypothetical protein H257_12519 [Aphanomyces astaci]ETV72370.1 hypothetical protein H257_12519 [Aphanomyces astaci]|eukprot:XP_009838052.1 hypothetical protein H257_12519 [Aphanomyces astaci]